MKTRLSRVLACLFAGILTVTAADYSVFAEGETPEIIYYVCPNSKILKEDETDYSGMTANGKLLFSAAANERESGQIILTKPGTYTGFKLMLENNLKDENGYEIPKEYFEIYFEHYVIAEQYRALKGLQSDNNGKVTYDIYPDVLIPQDLAADTRIEEANRANTFTLGGKKKNQGLWFTVTVPPGTPSGTYKGKLIGSLDVDVEVKVYDFGLDTVTNSRTRFAVTPGHLPSHSADYSTNLQGIVGMSADVKDANKWYQTVIDNLLDKRKITSGYNYGSFYHASTLDNDITMLTQYIRDSSTKAPFYNLYADSTTKTAPVTLTDCTQTSDKVLADFVLLSGISSLSVDDQNVLKYAIQNTGSDADRSQKQIVKQLDIIYDTVNAEKAKVILNTAQVDAGKVKQVREVASFFAYLLRSGEARLNRYLVKENGIGLEMVMKKITDRCIQDNYDYLEYAYIRLPQDDEAAEHSFWANIRTLVNNYIFDKTKDEVRTYIESQSINTEFKNKLLRSLDNIQYLNTITLTENEGNMSDLLYQGLNGIENKKVWEYYEEFCRAVYGKENEFYEEYTFFTGETVDIENDDGTITKKPVTIQYKIEIPMSYHLTSFCPLFNAFSSSDGVKGNHPSKLSETLSEHQAEGIKFWWYSTIVSARSASTAGYMVNENHGENTAIIGAKNLEMDALAVARANKWQQFYLGILGELYWGVDAFYFEYDADNFDNYRIKCDNLHPDDLYPYTTGDTELIQEHMYLKPDIGVTATRGGTAGYNASDGMLIYPVKQLLKNVYKITDENTLNFMAEKYGYFCSSLRLENIGEANDDYDYLCLAEQSVIRHPEYRDCLDTIICSVIEPGNVDYTNANLTNSANLAKARSELAKLIVDCQTDGQSEATNMESIDFDIPDVKYWNVSGKVLCFDVYETDNIQNTDSKAVKFTLMSEKTFLNHRIEIDFNTKTVSDCEGAKMIPKKNGLYTIYIPLDNVRKYDESSGEETLTHIHFSKDDVNCSFYAMNFQVYQEVTNTYPQRFENTYSFSSLDNWYNSGKTLCFDVRETDTYHNPDGSRTASIYLRTNQTDAVETTNMNHRIHINFSDFSVEGCDGAQMYHKGEGWYTVQIPLDKITLYDGFDGSQPLTGIHFSGSDVNTSFLLDGVRVYQEVAKIYPMKFENTLSLPSIKDWYNNGKTLSFDVRETDTYHASNGSRTVSFYLRTDKADAVETTNMNHRIYINFAEMRVEGCNGAMMYHKKDRWYTVQIPLDQLTLYDGFDGSQPITGVHFSGDDVNTSFLFDTDSFRVSQEVTNIYPKYFGNTFSFSKIENWYGHGKTLSFDVRETDTYHNPDGSRTVSFYLRTDKENAVNTVNMNHRIHIDFADMSITGCDGAQMYLNEHNWYTVQIPLDKIPLYNGFDGTQPLTGIHFSGGDVNTSFIFDTDSFRITEKAKENPVISIHAQPSKTVLEGDLNEDGCADESDVIELQNYLTGKDKNIQISWQEANLDHNGVLNAVDLTLLKRMLLAQQ